MKKLLSTLAIAAASTALAVESSNTFGILRVDSSAAQTIVSVPWLAAGGGDINVADVVKTANLNNGDKLHYYNTTTKKYRVWELTDGEWVEAKDAQDPVVAAPTLARGNAIILERFAPQGGSIANCFYLYGQYTNAASSTTCVAGGYTLLAPPSTENTNLNAKTWSNVNGNDNIVLANGTLLHYRENQWGKLTKTLDQETGVIEESVNPGVATISAGEGAWYISKGSTAPSVTWVAAPQQ